MKNSIYPHTYKNETGKNARFYRIIPLSALACSKASKSRIWVWLKSNKQHAHSLRRVIFKISYFDFLYYLTPQNYYSKLGINCISMLNTLEKLFFYCFNRIFLRRSLMVSKYSLLGTVFRIPCDPSNLNDCFLP